MMIKRFLLLATLTTLLNIPVFAQTNITPQIEVLAEGLYNPVGMALLNNGNLLIAEEGTGNDDLSAGVSMILPDGTIGRLISEFPSSRDSGDLSGIPLVSVSPDEETIYIGNFNAFHLWTLDASLAEKLPETPFTPDDLGIAMERFNNVVLANPFDMTYDADGVPIVSDATGNGVARELPNGTTQFFHRFEELQDPNNENQIIQAVPTGITRIEDEYYVTLFGGCPYPLDSGELVAIDEERNQRIVIDNLNMPIDVAVDNSGRIWVLEFARFRQDASCFSGMGYRSETGRLSYIENGELVTVLDTLDFPGAVLPAPDGSLYITQIFNGQVLRVTFDEQASAQNSTPPVITPNQAEYAYIEDYDSALQTIIADHDLTANPGQVLATPDPTLSELGQDLFFDPILSGDMNISCATCHHPAFAMGDGRVLPLGTGGIGLSETRSYLDHINLSPEYRGAESGQISNPFIGELVPRNSPTIINSALLPVQFWDGRVQSYAMGQPVSTLDQEVNLLNLTDALVVQALFPITSEAEMAGATFGDENAQHIRHQIAERLTNHPEYLARFSEIFDIETIEPIHIVTALAAFEQEFIFTQAPWDDYLAGDLDVLTDEQKRGALLFYGELNSTVNCAVCHSGNLFTDMQFYNLLVPQIGPGKGNGETRREDYGRANVTFDYRDQYTFRTVPLRNVGLTAPYFHTGAFATLEDVIIHHANIFESAISYDPANHLPSAYYSSTLPFNWERQGHSATPQLINGMSLSEQDIDDLVSFLQSLTDPAAENLSDFIPESVPSGLTLDEIPETQIIQVNTQTISNTTPIGIEDEASTEWHFEDIAAQVGIDFKHNAFETDLFADPAAMMGAGLCWIDYDKDGWLDLYLVNSYAEDEVNYWQENGGLPQNALYQNKDGIFTDVSQATQTNLSMRGNGCIVADFNNDRWDDIFITADGENALLLNNADGTFREVAGIAGINAPEWNSA
ncbi:MAG: ScyD/ScyE family protein, partial [Chloroflexota bacterium]